MGCLCTVIIEPRRLVRESLVSLLVNKSYRVTGDFASTEDIAASVVQEVPRLVILGAPQAENAAADASAIRKVWPEAKIMLLFEHASSDDFNELLTSDIDGCIPLFASQNTLIETLQLIFVEDLRILVVGISDHLLTPSSAQEDDAKGFAASVNKVRSSTADHAQARTSAITVPSVLSRIGDVRASKYVKNGETHVASSLRVLKGLSKREEQILEGLVKGQSNKTIARICDVTEATIKVHMKSILRKIRVTNRTQAAIWALERSYSLETESKSCFQTDSDRRNAPSSGLNKFQRPRWASA